MPGFEVPYTIEDAQREAEDHYRKPKSSKKAPAYQCTPEPVSSGAVDEQTRMPVPQRPTIIPHTQVPVRSAFVEDSGEKGTAWTELCEMSAADTWKVPEAIAETEVEVEVEMAPVAEPELPRKTSKFNEEGLSSKNQIPARKPVGSVNPKFAAINKVNRDADGFVEGMARPDAQGQVDTVPSTESRPAPKRTNSLDSLRSIAGSVKSGIRRLSLSLSKEAKDVAEKVADSAKNAAEITKMNKRERIDYRLNKAYNIPGSPSQLAFNRDSYEGQQSQPGTPTFKTRPGSLTTGEKLALQFSKATDPIKQRGRAETYDSDMSFGGTDQAPAGAMNECDECGEPTWKTLKHGLCEECYAAALKRAGEKSKAESEGMFKDPWQGRSTWQHGQAAEHGYMRLANKNKLVRIRQTIYEDPGNPFADELVEDETEEAPPASWFSREQSPVHRLYKAEPDEMENDEDDEAPPESWFSHGASQFPRPRLSGTDASTRSNSEYDGQRIQSLPSAPEESRDDLLVSAHREKINARQDHRRSYSVALAGPPPTEVVGAYVSPRKFWRQGSLPSVPVVQVESTDGKNVRDTKFYGFYDDIMSGYDNMDSKM